MRAVLRSKSAKSGNCRRRRIYRPHVAVAATDEVVTRASFWKSSWCKALLLLVQALEPRDKTVLGALPNFFNACIHHYINQQQIDMKRGGGKTPSPESGGAGPSPSVGADMGSSNPISPSPPFPPQASSSPAPPLGTERSRPADISAYIEPGVLEDKKRQNKRREPLFYIPAIPAFKWLRQYQLKKDLFWDCQVRKSASAGGEEGRGDERKG